MSEVNEEIQDTAQSFGERFMLQNAFRAYETCKHANAKELLKHILRLHMIDLLRENMSFFLLNEIISRNAAKNLISSFDKEVKEFVPYMNDCLEAFNLPKTPQMHA